MLLYAILEWGESPINMGELNTKNHTDKGLLK